MGNWNHGKWNQSWIGMVGSARSRHTPLIHNDLASGCKVTQRTK